MPFLMEILESGNKCDDFWSAVQMQGILTRTKSTWLWVTKLFSSSNLMRLAPALGTQDHSDEDFFNYPPTYNKYMNMKERKMIKYQHSQQL